MFSSMSGYISFPHFTLTVAERQGIHINWPHHTRPIMVRFISSKSELQRENKVEREHQKGMKGGGTKNCGETSDTKETMNK